MHKPNYSNMSCVSDVSDVSIDSIELKANPGFNDYFHSLILHESTFELNAGMSQRMTNEVRGDYQIEMIDDTNGVLKMYNTYECIDIEYTTKTKLYDVDVPFTLDHSPNWIEVSYNPDVYHMNKDYSKIMTTYRFKMDPLVALQFGSIPVNYEPPSHMGDETIFYELGEKHRLDEILNNFDEPHGLKDGYVCTYSMLGFNPAYEAVSECGFMIRQCIVSEQFEMIKKFRTRYHEISAQIYSEIKLNTLLMYEKYFNIVAEYSKYGEMISFCFVWMGNGTLGKTLNIEQIWSQNDVLSKEFLSKIAKLKERPIKICKISIDSVGFKEQIESFLITSPKSM